MMWHDALPGSAFTTRATQPGDIDDVVRGMTIETFVDHFEPVISRSDAVNRAQEFGRECRCMVTIATERPVYVIGVHPVGVPVLKGLLFGLPGRDIAQHAPAIARWFLRVYLPRLRVIDMVPVATASPNALKSRRWIEAAGGLPKTINGLSVLAWET